MSNENNGRGMEQFVGETVKYVDTSSINVAHFHMLSGKIVSVDAEEEHFGIPIVAVSEDYKV